MAVVIDATVGGANANSYLTLAQAQAIIDGFVEDADVQHWNSGTLIAATGRCLLQRNG